MKQILIMAGGTGGHVFPALAVAEELRRHGHQVSWLGTRHGLESEVVPRANIAIDYISVKGLRGNGIFGWIVAPFRLARALVQAIQICRKIKPDVVLGMGGFVTGPGGVACWLMRTPLVIHEQNAIPGMTNRWLTRIASRVLQAFPGSFQVSVKAVTTGNPVRSQINTLVDPAQRYTEHQGAIRLLVVGGSLGAKALNEMVPAAIAMLEQSMRPAIWHQAGKDKNITTQRVYDQYQIHSRVEPFIVNMAEAYAWADIIICRAGAMTVSELCNAGLASILVPFPHAVDDHQTANARFLADAGAAIVIQQTELTPSKLSSVLRELFAQGRQHLQHMATSARQLARPDATATVAHICLEVARG